MTRQPISATDPRVDAYIDKSAPFAQPILEHIRSLVHNACPDVRETMKWSFPHFDYKGMMCSMAAFGEHCSFTFWKASLLKDPDKVLTATGAEAMGQLGKIMGLADLPSDRIMIKYVKEAAALNEKGVKVHRPKPAPKKPARIPADLAAALKNNKKALATFAKFPPSHKREYIGWITEAKRPGTRAQRIARTVAWVAEGKQRNWKYAGR